jgi:acyl-coenzyme A thioesterase PaaI-like protein
MLPAMDLAAVRQEWFPPADAASPSRASRHRTAATLREAVDLLAGLDVEAAAPEDLEALEGLAGQLRDHLAALPCARDAGSLAMAAPPTGTLVERSPVSGRGNVLAPPLEYRFDGEVTRGWLVFSSAYEGPPGGAHGGAVAAVLDEILGVAQMASGTAGYTGTLTIRYHRVTPLGVRVDYESRVLGRDGRKLTIGARSHAGGTLLAEAEGTFITQTDLSRTSGSDG